LYLILFLYIYKISDKNYSKWFAKIRCDSFGCFCRICTHIGMIMLDNIPLAMTWFTHWKCVWMVSLYANQLIGKLDKRIVWLKWANYYELEVSLMMFTNIWYFEHVLMYTHITKLPFESSKETQKVLKYIKILYFKRISTNLLSFLGNINKYGEKLCKATIQSKRKESIAN